MELGDLTGPALIASLVIAAVGGVLIATKGMSYARGASIVTGIAILINAVLAALTRDTVNQQFYLVLTVVAALICAVLLAIGSAIGSGRMRRGG